jgi:NAD(P)H dehydrogenase (quinone)
MSFNQAILEEVTRGLQDGGHTYEVIDLYKIKFNPVFDNEDYTQFADPNIPEEVLEEMKLKDLVLLGARSGPFGFIKEAMVKRWMKKKKLTEIIMEIGKHKPKDVLEQQEKVANADALVYIFPLIWNNFPAILLGWMQRVLAYGFAYELTPEGWNGDPAGRLPLLKHKKALMINTTFFTEKELKKRGFHDAMEKIMVEWSLKYPGIKDVKHIYFYAPLAVGEKVRKEYLHNAYRLGKEF